MDVFGWYIATQHNLLGHDKTAAFNSVPIGDKSRCLLCRYEREPTAENRAAVIDALRLYTVAGDPAVSSTRDET